MRELAFPVALLLAIAGLVSSPTSASSRTLEVATGTVAESQVVAVDRDVVVGGEVLDDVVVVSGEARIAGEIAGDLIVLDGDAMLDEGAAIAGDVFVVGGELRTTAGAWIGGRSVAYASLPAAWMTLLEGPSLGLPATSPIVLGAKLALLCAWLVLVLVLFPAAGRELLATSASVAGSPLHNFTVGVAAVFTLVLTALFIASFAASLLALPLLFLVVFFALALKLWGMTALFHAVGERTARRLGRRLLPLTAAACGLVGLGILKLVPWVGVWVWTVATFIAVGATLTSSFGRRVAGT